MFWRESNGIVVGPSGVYNCGKCPCDPGGNVPICNSSPWPKTWDDDFETYTAYGLPLRDQSANWENIGSVSDVVSNGANNAIAPRAGSLAVKPGPATRLYFDGNLDVGISTQVQMISSSGYPPVILPGFFQPVRRIGMNWWNRQHPDDFGTAHNSNPATNFGVWLYYSYTNSQWETRAPYETSPTAVAGPSYSLPHTLKITATLQSFTYDDSTGAGEFEFDFDFLIDGVSRRTVSGNTHTHPVNTLNTDTMCIERYGFFYDGSFTSVNGGAAMVFDNWESDITPATP